MYCACLEGRFGSLRLVSTMGLDLLLLAGWGVLVPLSAMILLTIILIICASSVIFIAIYDSVWLRTDYIPSRLMLLWVDAIYIVNGVGSCVSTLCCWHLVRLRVHYY